MGPPRLAGGWVSSPVFLACAVLGGLHRVGVQIVIHVRVANQPGGLVVTGIASTISMPLSPLAA